MRTTKIMSFSVPPEFEEEIQALAKKEHRTISEFLREAVRQYIAAKNLADTRASIADKLRKKGLSEQDVEEAVRDERKGIHSS